MVLKDLERWFNSVLDIHSYVSADPSRNGVQVENDGADIKLVAFAVDASLQTIEKAAAAGAGLLVVHHGLFWRDSICVTGSHYARLKTLFNSNLALYASHLPLDAHPEIGNNAGIAQKIGLEFLEPFGEWRGSMIGFKGKFPEPVSLDTILKRLFSEGKKNVHILPFGPEKIRTAAIVSGGASGEVHQAMQQGCDLYITGEVEHEIYHPCLEGKISVIGAGHYETETIGVRLLSQRLALETSIDTVFIDAPTGL
ncbi:MAG TPA: Nif3-like dinuclear metal center hexameric protein [Treponemataceae bacterium]|nr:Nif3-like dinuclear metal center hexameric protein [Treponemataceae bacterium]